MRCPFMMTATREVERDARRLNPAFSIFDTRKTAFVFAGITVTPSTITGSSRFAAYYLSEWVGFLGINAVDGADGDLGANREV